jgi:hypothetical protein
LFCPTIPHFPTILDFQPPYSILCLTIPPFSGNSDFSHNPAHSSMIPCSPTFLFISTKLCVTQKSSLSHTSSISHNSLWFPYKPLFLSQFFDPEYLAYGKILCCFHHLHLSHNSVLSIILYFSHDSLLPTVLFTV